MLKYSQVTVLRAGSDIPCGSLPAPSGCHRRSGRWRSPPRPACPRCSRGWRGRRPEASSSFPDPGRGWEQRSAEPWCRGAGDGGTALQPLPAPRCGPC